MIKKLAVLAALVAGALQVTRLPSARAQGTTETREEGAEVPPSSSSILFPRAALEKLANLTQADSLWLLIPSNVSESQLHESDFSLFRLNTGQLLDQGGWAQADADAHSDETSSQPEGSASGRSRAGRKLNLFKNVLGKPQVSPLYLVNGTVCRFVNSQPICTTLSTTGLFRGQNQGAPQLQGGGTFGGLLQGNNQQQQQLPNNQQLPNQRQVSPPLQGGQFQQFRPAAVLDDEQPGLSVANLTSRAQLQQSARPGAQSLRPMASQYSVRRPLNLLALGRPFRSG